MLKKYAQYFVIWLSRLMNYTHMLYIVCLFFSYAKIDVFCLVEESVFKKILERLFSFNHAVLRTGGHLNMFLVFPRFFIDFPANSTKAFTP